VAIAAYPRATTTQIPISGQAMAVVMVVSMTLSAVAAGNVDRGTERAGDAGAAAR
jgi:hypothetical protein